MLYKVRLCSRGVKGIKASQDGSGGFNRVRWGQFLSSEVNSGQVGSSKVRLDQVRSDEVRQNMIRYGKDILGLGERLNEDE